MKTPHQLVPPEPMDRLGQRLASLLEPSCAEVSHDLSERLRIARTQALMVRKPEPAPRQQWAAHSGSLTLSGPPTEGLGLWSILGSALPLLALLAALGTLQWQDQDQIVSDMAEIDTALLVDDLPPAAYSDAGFMQFLRQSGATPVNQD